MQFKKNSTLPCDLLFSNAESRSGHWFNDHQLRARKRHRLHQTLYESRNQHHVQGALINSPISIILSITTTGSIVSSRIIQQKANFGLQFNN